jgi:hypothetical protein
MFRMFAIDIAIVLSIAIFIIMIYTIVLTNVKTVV